MYEYKYLHECKFEDMHLLFLISRSVSHAIDLPKRNLAHLANVYLQTNTNFFAFFTLSLVLIHRNSPWLRALVCRAPSGRAPGPAHGACLQFGRVSLACQLEREQNPPEGAPDTILTFQEVFRTRRNTAQMVLAPEKLGNYCTVLLKGRRRSRVPFRKIHIKDDRTSGNPTRKIVNNYNEKPVKLLVVCCTFTWESVTLRTWWQVFTNKMHQKTYQ